MALDAMFSMPGGKHFQKKRLLAQFPPHDKYIETNVGAGSLFFGKPRCKTEIINDLDPEIAFFYRYIQKHSTPPKFPFKHCSRSQYAYYIHLKPKTDHDRFIRMFILQQCSWRGKRGLQNFTPTRAAAFNLQNNKFLKNYGEYHKRLQGVIILNEDYKKVIARHDSPDAFIYMDPPYETNDDSSVTNAPGGDWYGKVNPAELAKTVRGIKGKWMLSFSNHPELKKHLQDFNIECYSTRKCKQ